MIQQFDLPSKGQHSVHYITFSAVLFLIILIVSSIAFWFSMRHIIRDSRGTELTRMLEIKRIKLETSVNSKIAIILKMAESPLIVRYFSNPDDPELADMAIEEINSYRNALAGSIFWVSDIDKKFYFDMFDTRDSYILDPELPENYWYNQTLYETHDYNFNINYNPNLDMVNLWINAPVFDGERKPIGMTGCGLDVSAFVRELYAVYQERADIFFFNAEGEITGAKDINLVIAKKHIDTMIPYDDGILAAAQRLSPGGIHISDSPLGKVAIGTVPVLGWYSAAIMPDSIDDYKNPISAVFIVMLAVMALIIIIFNIFIASFLKSLHKTMDSLERTSRYKSEFLARMSHEIRTPMNAILGMSELAIRERDCKHVFTIKKSCTGLLSIINDILDFSKIESGTFEVSPMDYHFTSLIDDVTNIIKIKIQESRLEFRIDIDSQIPNVLFGDETRVRQVMLNILDNAIKYTSKGFVAFSVKGTPVDADNVLLTIEVADSGMGIKKEDIEKLFTDFVQLDPVKNSGIEGTGLGLAIAQRLVKEMGGNISAQSEYGKGSTFTITLPQGISSNTIIGHRSVVSIFKAPKAKVLVVDDVPVNLTVAKGLLAMYEVQIHTCINGEEAVEAVQAEEYDLVFMDHMMPGMDGLEATAIIRRLKGERFQKLPIVALTANAILGTEEMFLQSGFDDYLSKPINIQKLNAVLVRWIPTEKQKVLTDIP